MKKQFCILFILIIFKANAQTFVKPNYGIKSHEVLNIDSIRFTNDNTVIFIRAKVPAAGSGFCVNSNTFLIVEKAKYKLTKAINVSICPDSKVYKNKGEVFQLELHFPPSDSITKTMDLIEACNDECFYFKGIILDKMFNSEIEEAYDAYAKSSSLALEKFKAIIDNHPDYRFGFAYINIIKILAEKNEMKQSHEWYVRMMNALLIDKNELDDIIKKQPYYNLIK